MITPDEIRKKALRKYPDYLSSIVSGPPFFPLILPSNKKISADFRQLHTELSQLIEHSKDKKGYGYTVSYHKVTSRKHGSQQLPSDIFFETEQDYLKFTGKKKEAERFKEELQLIQKQLPQLDQWLKKHFKKLLTYHGKWHDIIKVCLYFLNTPCPNLYIRELPVQVHTKFIEEHKPILRQLLDILIREYINDNENHFEKRFNLKHDEPLIRILLLDSEIAQYHFSGITDLSLRVSAFEKLHLPVKRIFILENKTNFSNIYNFLTLPHMKDSLALFGKGFGAGLLEGANWLKDKTIYYWGDIDTHGLLILNQLRKSFPQTIAFLMDRETLTAHKYYWGQGEHTVQESLKYLTEDEKDLFQFLKTHNVRLEQEKIEHEYVVSEVRKMIKHMEES